MGEEGAVSEKLEPVGNGKVEVDEKDDVGGKTEAGKDTKWEQPDGVTEMEEDKQEEEKTEAQKMDVDKEEANREKAESEKVTKEEGIEKKEKQEETQADEEKHEAVKDDGGREEFKDEKMEEEAEEDKGKVTEEKVEKEDVSKEEEDKQEETEADEEKHETVKDDGGKEEVRDEKMEEEAEEDTGKVTEEVKEAKGSRKRPRSKTGGRRGDKTTKKELAEVEKEPEKAEEQITPARKKTKEPKSSVGKREIEPKTPSAFSSERPVRERKSVERLVATIEKDTSRDFRIVKGRGTALKDIPNVAYKLSRKKTEETFKMLHMILFGRRGKAAQVKNNISRFSGFVWHDNEEKQMNRLKEKLDKYVKEKLLEFCDVLDVPISKASAKKEDIIVKLTDFFMEPHATTSDLLAEKEQGAKRKRSSKPASRSTTPSKGSVKSRKKVESDSKNRGEAKSASLESEDESEQDKGEDLNGDQDGSKEMSDQAASEEIGSESEEESVEDKGKKKAGSAKSSIKKGSSEKPETKKVTISKKTSPPPKKLPAKSPDRSKSNSDSSSKKSSVKKKDETVKISSIPKKLPSNDSPGKARVFSFHLLCADVAQVESPWKKVLKIKQKPKEETLEPSDDDLRNSICKILQKVDFNKATFTDILKLLATEFDTNLAARKSTVKLMIQEELTKLADADAADEKDEGNAEKDEKAPSGKGVKAT
ncbi:hypothetical protein SASPL_114273 [Salvia splendens]|uniref:DEK-C domain-containing protein n=1 Tax=Salvia splendens TaxID=180675 RepID=A0A8X9A0J6_SALSN|nr:hypothetical protein SASPL_114273 [Salvia splendens]